mmetsp:Transcript_38253/g.68600  ORF Transcript_38253/g.68600 Transcript_38253/m.68600 type:complete len:248 (+) Transcript_38253:154-897(+)
MTVPGEQGMLRKRHIGTEGGSHGDGNNAKLLVDGVHDDAAGLQRRPHPALVVDGLQPDEGQHGDPLHAHQLAVIMLRLGSPSQESRYILGLLRLGGRGAVLVLHTAIRQHLGHRNGAAGEVGVVVEPLTDADASRGVTVAEQQGEDVVLAVVTGLCDEAEVRGIGAAVGVAGVRLIHVGRGQLVGQLAGAIEHLALVVGAVLHLNLRRHRLGLLLRVAHAYQLAEVNEVQAMASGTHLSVHLMATAD